MNLVTCTFLVTAQPYRVVSQAAQSSGLTMWDVLEQRSVLMTVAIQVGGLKTVGLQRQLKLFVKVKFFCNSYIHLICQHFKAKNTFYFILNASGCCHSK